MDHQIISDEVLDKVQLALSKGNNWMVYNNSLYFINPADVNFFDNKDSANEFAESNDSDYDHHVVIYVSSIADVLQKIPYDESFIRQIISIDANGLHNSEGNAFTDALIEHIEQQQILINKNKNVMNQKNFEYLRDQVKFTGFGAVLENELKGNLQKQAPEFQLTATTMFGNDDVVARLHFKKSEQSDMYFFNNYKVSFVPEQSKDKMEQTFYINKEGSITLKEAYNLMNGRAINKDLTSKEGQVYNAWLQMDFKQTENNGNYKLKQFHQNYGYDLVNAMEKHPIKELTNELDKTRLLESLQKGNRQAVTFIQNGNEQKHFIEANPQFKTINIYDSHMQRVSSKQEQGERQGQGEQQTTKKNIKNESNNLGDSDDGDAMPKASNKKRKKQSNSISS